MTRDPGNEIRDRFRAMPLPPAPVRLHERLATVASSPGATTRSRFGRVRLVVALAAVVATASVGLLVGGGTESPSPSPDGDAWGPLAVANLMAAEAALTHGELLFTDQCAYLVEGDGTRVLLVWPAARTSWDVESRTVLLEHLQTNDVVALREGVPLELGGGGSSIAEDGLSGEEWAARFDWVAPPATECLTDTRWVVSDAVTPVAVATPEAPSYAIRCTEASPPALSCAEIIDAALTAVGSDRRIVLIYVQNLCAPPATSGCAPTTPRFVQVGFAPPAAEEVLLTVAPGEDGLVVVLHGPDPSVDPGTRLVCTDAEPPALTCAEVVDATLAALGSDGPPIAQIDVGRLCRTSNPCQPALTVDVEVTFASADTRPVRLWVNPGPDGPLAEVLGPDLRDRWFSPPYGCCVPFEATVEIDTMRVSDDRRTLTVEFEGGGCVPAYGPWVEGTGGELRVAIIAFARAEPLPSRMACILPAYRYTYHLGLSEPFTGSVVVDLSNGKTFEVAPS